MRFSSNFIFRILAFFQKTGKLQAMKNFLLVLIFFLPSFSFAQTAEVQNEFHRGTVIEARSAVAEEIFGEQSLAQELRVELNDGRIVAIPAGQYQAVVASQLLTVGDPVILESSEGKNFRVLESNRISNLWIIIGIFLVLVLLVAGKQGFTGIIGLMISLLIISLFFLPQIVSGRDPLLMSLISCSLITGISIWVSHGWKPRTHIAVAATFLTLLIAFGLAWLSISLSGLHGLGSENSYFLHVALPHANMSGLLLGAILLGTVGILDDVTTTQAATVDELSKANVSLNWKELFIRGMSVGREHISSVINTLALAYVAAALPMFILIVLDTERPWWVVFNSEFFAEEVVRTLLGSGALVLAVPITTLFSALFFARKK
jgi:uncharacterized membrane protein